MRLLLDTHLLLWWLADDSRLSERAANLIDTTGNEVFVSAISLWEVAIKSRLGRLSVDVDTLLNAIADSSFRSLSFTVAHAAAVARLPDLHRDPFDRALIAQARHEPLVLLTRDQAVAIYGHGILLV